MFLRYYFRKEACVCVKPCVPRVTFSFSNVVTCRGAEEALRALPNEALYGVLRILGLINPAYLHKVRSFSFFQNQVFRQC